MKTAGIILLSLGVLVVAAGPVGTVLGMIRAFNEISESGGEPDPEQMADGIQFALWSKVVGLLLGPPMALAGLILLIVGIVRNKRVPTPGQMQLDAR